MVFSLHPMDGRMKIALHGEGYELEEMTNECIESTFRKNVQIELRKHKKFMKESFPRLGETKVVGGRLCPYCDSFDGDWLIDHDPNFSGLVVACGDSGHAFKFTPIIGTIISDVIENKPNKYRSRFQWREVPNPTKEESRNVNTIPHSNL